MMKTATETRRVTAFGQDFAPHMLLARYAGGRWETPEIVPFGDIPLSPATLALHYGQSVFEGMKAFARVDGRVGIFRTDKHHERFNLSLERMCMPQVPAGLFVEGLKNLVQTDFDHVPVEEGSSLYIRPFMFASEKRFGVKVSDEYLFIVFAGAVPAYYKEPLRVKVEREFVRAARGGTGYAKCAGNYGGAFYPTQQANLQGYDQVLWTDGLNHEYIEESGTMNVCFVMDGTLVTPPLSGTILDGVTRDSLLTLAADLGIPAEVRPVSVTELKEAAQAGRLQEAFGAGTAAVVAPIAAIGIDGTDYQLPEPQPDAVMHRLKQELQAIRTGAAEDRYGWNTVVARVV